jgi:hypothetical protein
VGFGLGKLRILFQGSPFLPRTLIPSAQFGMEAQVRVLASVADALFPPLKDKALISAKDGDELSAQLYVYAGGSSDEIMLKARPL